MIPLRYIKESTKARIVSAKRLAIRAFLLVPAVTVDGMATG